MAEYGLVFVGGFFSVVGLGSALSAVSTYRETNSLKLGAVVKGRIASAVIESETFPDDDRESYRPVIRYQYAVGNQQYQSTELTREPTRYGWSQDEAAARTIVDKYPAGAEVQIFYDPRNPTVSALELTETTLTTTLLSVLFGLGFMLLGAYMCLAALREPAG